MSDTGYRISRFDGRDWQSSSTDFESQPPISSPFPPIDQGEARCCVGAVTTAAMEILDNRDGTAVRLSPLFNYYTSRYRPRTSLGLVSLREGLLAAATTGVCSYEAHEGRLGVESPFSSDAARLVPDGAAYDEAERRKLVSFDTSKKQLAFFEVAGAKVAEEWARAIESGHPVAFGFVPSAAYRGLSKESFRISDVSEEQGRAGHAALAIGYSDGHFRIRDSRGIEFGDEGYWEVSESVVQTRWVAESWVITRITYDD